MFREFQGHIQRVHELVDFDRLGEIAEESCCQALLHVARHGVGAERHHGQCAGHRVLRQDTERDESADTGQVDVHEYDVGPLGARRFDAADAVRRDQ